MSCKENFVNMEKLEDVRILQAYYNKEFCHLRVEMLCKTAQNQKLGRIFSSVLSKNSGHRRVEILENIKT